MHYVNATRELKARPAVIANAVVCILANVAAMGVVRANAAIRAIQPQMATVELGSRPAVVAVPVARRDLAVVRARVLAGRARVVAAVGFPNGGCRGVPEPAPMCARAARRWPEEQEAHEHTDEAQDRRLASPGPVGSLPPGIATCVLRSYNHVRVSGTLKL